MKEQLIAFETAKLAKEKGFNEHCRKLYIDSKLTSSINIYPFEFINNEEIDEHEINGCSVPTQSLLQKWLREEHNIEISIYPYTSVQLPVYQHGVRIYLNTNHMYADRYSAFNFKTYEDALEDALKKSLELIKHE